MTLGEIKALVEGRSKYPLKHVGEDDGAILIVLETPTPDGASAVSSFAVSRLVLEQAREPQALLEDRVDQACGGLERYVGSFNAPAWDQMAWSK